MGKYISLTNYYLKAPANIRSSIDDLLEVHQLDNIVELQHLYHKASDRKALAQRWNDLGLSDLAKVFDAYEKAANVDQDRYFLTLRSIERGVLDVGDSEAFNAIQRYAALVCSYNAVRRFIKFNHFELVAAECAENLILANKRILSLPEKERMQYSYTVVHHSAYDIWKKEQKTPLTIDFDQIAPPAKPQADHSRIISCVLDILLGFSENDRHLLVSSWLQIQPRFYDEFCSHDIHTLLKTEFGDLLDDIPMNPGENRSASHVSRRRAKLKQRFDQAFEKSYHK